MTPPAQESNEAATEELIAKLDALVPRDGARVSLSQYGGGPDESRVVANRRGYLRLGIEFLRAAFAPHEKQHLVKADIRYLLTDDSDVGFNWFERREDLPQATPESRRARIIGPIIGFGFLGLVVLCALVGLVTIVRWFL
jgi:hypothetical protein